VGLRFDLDRQGRLRLCPTVDNGSDGPGTGDAFAPRVRRISLRASLPAAIFAAWPSDEISGLNLLLSRAVLSGDVRTAARGEVSDRQALRERRGGCASANFRRLVLVVRQDRCGNGSS